MAGGPSKENSRRYEMDYVPLRKKWKYSDYRTKKNEYIYIYIYIYIANRAPLVQKRNEQLTKIGIGEPIPSKNSEHTY